MQNQGAALLVEPTSVVKEIINAVNDMNAGVPADEALKNLSQEAKNAMLAGTEAKLGGSNIVITDKGVTLVVKYFGGVPDPGERIQ